MKTLLKVLRNLMSIIGFILIFGAVGTSDYYTIELKQSEPDRVWVLIIIGFALLIPAILHGIFGGDEH